MLHVNIKLDQPVSRGPVKWVGSRQWYQVDRGAMPLLEESVTVHVLVLCVCLH